MRLHSYGMVMAVLAASVATAQQVRVWTDVSGQWRCSARFVRAGGGTAELLVPGSERPVQVPLARLSDADIVHIVRHYGVLETTLAAIQTAYVLDDGALTPVEGRLVRFRGKVTEVADGMVVLFDKEREQGAAFRNGPAVKKGRTVTLLGVPEPNSTYETAAGREVPLCRAVTEVTGKHLEMLLATQRELMVPLIRGESRLAERVARQQEKQWQQEATGTAGNASQNEQAALERRVQVHDLRKELNDLRRRRRQREDELTRLTMWQQTNRRKASADEFMRARVRLKNAIRELDQEIEAKEAALARITGDG